MNVGEKKKGGSWGGEGAGGLWGKEKKPNGKLKAQQNSSRSEG